MLGTLPESAKKNWQEWVPTLVHAYNCTTLSVTGFSPYFLIYGRQPKLPIDIEYFTSDQFTYLSNAKLIKWVYLLKKSPKFQYV